MGGPPLYMNEFGHPRLRARHMPFSVGEGARDQWMMCMRKALADIGIEEPLKSDLEMAFYQVADFMRNQMSDDELPRL